MKVKSVYKEYRIDGQFDYFFIDKDTLDGKVTLIEYYPWEGIGDANHVSVYFENGNKVKIFNPDTVEFEVG